MIFVLSSHTYAENTQPTKSESSYINYTKLIKAWAIYTFVSNDVTFKVVSVTRYHDGYDKETKNKTKFLVLVKYEDVSLAYLLFISPKKGIERYTFLGSSLFLDNEEPHNPEPLESQSEKEM